MAVIFKEETAKREQRRRNVRHWHWWVQTTAVLEFTATRCLWSELKKKMVVVVVVAVSSP